jgi:hypothetical protein
MPPLAIATKLGPPSTATGVWLPFVVPSPIPPAGFASQQYAWNAGVTPQIALAPAASR